MDLNGTKPPIRLRTNVRLALLSTFRIGGRAARFGRVRTPEELIALVGWAKQAGLPCRVFAGGSNIVFPDRTLDGLLVQLSGGKLSFRGTRCVADAGVPLGEVIEQAIRRGLRGLETLSGIPGTIGGAVVGNAGAYGHSISEAIARVEVWDGDRRRFLTRRQCRFEYRESIFKKKPLLLLRVTLHFRRGKAKELRKISRDIIRLRLKKYRPGLRCPGSFFKNVLVKDAPQASLERIDPAKIIEGKIPAGYLLEQAGAKGMRVGGIVIAPFHGNLFINRGRARARDVRRLARILKRRVSRRFGIRLEEEIRYF
jgi:UDP-N-acetylmuramate dehydrogenase